ncbi:MAG: hypothetical protein SFT94_08710 [Pseudanabaenaceae cyanobacterium bins.68]|nr:hypothetical protein [Pseudanabaenaceae cyanobacterium bins.68]
MRLVSPIGAIAWLGITFLVYGLVLPGFFLSDDFGFVSNLAELCPVSLWDCSKKFGGALFFRPLTSLSFYTDYLLWQKNAWGYHGTNLVFHGINCYLVALLGTKLTGSARAGIIAGLIFLVLPSHCEAVTWISARADLLCTALVLTGLLLHLYGRSWLACLLFGLALTAKESGIIYPLLLYPPVIRGSRRWRLVIAYGLVLLSYLTLRYLALGVVIGGYGAGISWQQIPLNLWHSLGRTFLPPWGARMIYPLTGIILGLGIWRSRYLSRSNQSICRWLTIAYFVCLLPVLNLSVSLTTTQEERFLYLPSVFGCILLAVLLDKIRILKYLTIGILNIGLQSSIQVWVAAAQISSTMVQSLAEIPPAPVLYVVNLPDRLEGAYIFRNSFPRAVRLFQPGRFQQVKTLAFHPLRQPQDFFTITDRNQLTSSVYPLDFYFKQGGKILDADLEPLTTPDFQITDLSDRGFRFVLPQVKVADQVVYYSRGRLRSVPRFPGLPVVSGAIR